MTMKLTAATACPTQRSSATYPIGVNEMAGLVSESDAADFILADSRDQGELLTNLKLQKLLYYGQAWYLAQHGESLFNEDFQAWIHGPVLPSQYRRFRTYEWRPILAEMKKPVTIIARVVEHLVEVVRDFGSESAIALELMTHREKPWIDARAGLPATEPSQARITKSSMRDFYRSL